MDEKKEECRKVLRELDEALRNPKITILTDAEIDDFVSKMSMIDLRLQRSILLKDIKELMVYVKVIQFDLFSRSLKSIEKELIEREAKEGVFDFE